MPHNLQRNLSRIFRRRANAIGNAEHEDAHPVPNPHRPRPTFSLSSLSFRRPSATSSEPVLTPPSTPPPSESDNASEGEDVVLHVRNLSTPLDEGTQIIEPGSYFDLCLPHPGRTQHPEALERFHARSEPPSPLSAAYPHPPRPLKRRQRDTSDSRSTSAMSHAGANEPRSAFSDWGTSVGETSTNVSSGDLSVSDEEVDGSRGSATEGTRSAEEAIRTTDYPRAPGTKRTSSRTSSRPALSTSPKGVSTAGVTLGTLLPHSSDVETHRTVPNPHENPTVSRPDRHRPHLAPHHHHHHHHSHHSTTTHAKPQPRDSNVADSSYPELAIAFFLSLKQFNARQIERRASTGSLGGAV